MDSQRVGYTINPETGKQIKIGGPTWKRLAAKYYRVSDTFTDQTIPDSRAYVSNKIFANDDSDDSSSESEYVDIDEFEYDADGHAIFPF